METQVGNNLEIERKFLLRSLPDESKYTRVGSYVINQVYIEQDIEGVELRVRSLHPLALSGHLEDDRSRYVLTIKCESDSSSGFLVREEIEDEISREMFMNIKNSGNQIRSLIKTRNVYICDKTGKEFVVDIFDSGMMMLEIEFDTCDSSNKFRVPADWDVDREVTGDPWYRSYNLAIDSDIKKKSGKVVAVEIPKKSKEITPPEPSVRNGFLDLINNPVLRTDNVIRFSGLFQLNQELLSTHIVDVQIMSLSMARNLIQLGESVDVGSLLEKCLLHDVDEVLVGDIPRLTKYSSAECYRALNSVADSVVKDMSSAFDGTNYLHEVWFNAKDETIEGYLLKLSDMVSVARKCVNEVEVLNNNNFLRVAIEMLNYVNDLRYSVPDDLFQGVRGISYINSILNGAYYTLSRIIKERSSIIDRYEIENNATKDIISNRYKEEDTDSV